MKIPSSSIPRLSIYYRALLSLKKCPGISSKKLATLTGCSANQIRKDLAYFGQFGTPGYGYKIEKLKENIREILGIDRKRDMALAGVGNLGSALLAYKGFRSQGFNIKYAFDNDRKKIDKIKEGVKIKNITNLAKDVKSHRIEMAIVAVPQNEAQTIVDTLISSGIKAILNFAPIRPKVPEGVEILNIDLSVELEKLTYFLQSKIRYGTE